MIARSLKKYWTRFWMHYSSLSPIGRIATHLATWFCPPYYGRCPLARFNKRGYISLKATIHHDGLALGENVFVGDGVIIYNHIDGGQVKLGDRVHLYGDTYIQTGQGGSVQIGRDTHIQPRCQFSAYSASIIVGNNVQIAPGCAFYPYDHGVLPGELICNQPLVSKGDIEIGDDVWLGFGAIILSGVSIGKGAVIGAGSVVTRSIPDGAIATGIPARILKMRSDFESQ